MPVEAPIRDIQIQPIKGGGPLKLEEARMTKAGLETVDGNIQDHFLFVVDAKEDDHGDHNFLTQRVQVNPDIDLHVPGTPQLALIRPEQQGETLIFHFQEQTVTAPHPTEDDQSNVINVQIWEYRGKAVEVPVLSEWLSDNLRRNVLVARTSGPWDRKTRQNFEINDNPLRAQDGYPIHAVAYTDAEAVFNALDQPVDPNRFRYQVLLDGVRYRQIHVYAAGRVNNARVRQPKPCGRCEVTGIDQKTGEFSRVKPLAGLVRLGEGRWVRSETRKEHVMGENWLPQGETVIRKGDIFVFTEKRATPLVFEQRR